MRVLVVGGAGYIGSHTVRELVAQGFSVRILDDLCTGSRSLVGNHELVVANMRDRHAVKEALHGVGAVIHFAAHAYVGESVVDPRKYFENNVGASLALLNAIGESDVRLLVFSSSCAVYGIPERIPIQELDPCRPVNPYGVTKLFFEEALRAYHRAYGVRSISLRYFNAAGAHPSGEIGELHEPETHIIPCVLRAAAGLQPYFEIFGDDYPTPDGTCIRDYVHVCDLARAHVSALRHLLQDAECEAFNLGTGRGYSVRDVVAECERATGRPIPIRITPRRIGDPPVLLADPSAAQRVLEWKARHTLPEMVASAWRWLQSQQHALVAHAD